MDKIILIGGAPTSGKSYAARKLAEDIKLPWISTDGIREQMRELVRREDYPELFHFAEEERKTAEEYLSNHTAEEIVKSQNAESEEVWKGVRAFIETDYVWESFIVEGVAILPHLVHWLKVEEKDIRPCFL